MLDRSVAGVSIQPSQRDVDKLVARIRKGENWGSLFPGVATLQLDSSGSGFAISLRISKKEGEPVRLVAEGTPGAYVVGVKRVNELDYYSLNGRQLAQKIGLSEPKMRALAYYTGVRGNEEYYKEFKIGSQIFKRYSPKSIGELKQAKQELDIEAVWRMTNGGTMRPEHSREH